MSTITALAPWYGSKRTLAPRIVEELGDHSAYWELPCGSMAVILAKPRSRSETVVEMHGDLVNLARVIQDPRLGPALYRRLRRVLSNEAQFKDSLAVVRSGEPGDSPDVDRAFHYFVSSWQGMNGVAGTSSFNTNFCKRYSNKGGDPGARWSGAVRSIPAWRRRIERVNVILGDLFKIIGEIVDSPNTAIYVDPPYLSKGAKYKHDFERESPGADTPLVLQFGDHGRLALALRRFKLARIVVSYYDDASLALLYPGWTLRRLDATKSLVSAGKRGQDGRVEAPEVLLINGPSLAGRGAPTLF